MNVKVASTDLRNHILSINHYRSFREKNCFTAKWAKYFIKISEM